MTEENFTMHNMQAHKFHLLTTHQQTSYMLELDSMGLSDS
jgi:hypothetical protein